MKLIKRILLVLLVALIAIQFYRPSKNDATDRDVSAFEKETKVTLEVKNIFESKCYDCLSNKTTYPLYAEVAPISFWIKDHVEEGKEHFNVSQWSMYSDKKKDHKLEELIEEVEEGEMPLDSYTWLHGDITQKEKETLLSWGKQARSNYAIK